MSTGTLIRVSGLAEKKLPDQTLDSSARETSTPEEHVREQMLERQSGPRLYFREHNTYYADVAHFRSQFSGKLSGTFSQDWGIIQPEIYKTVLSVWDTAKFAELLSQPVGSPIELTLEEADEIVRLAAGRRPDLPTGKDYVREIREILGHSLADRLKKSE